MRCTVHLVIVALAAIFDIAFSVGEKPKVKTYKSAESLSLKTAVPQISRLKDQIDQIRVDDISPFDVKHVIMTESVEANPLNVKGHYQTHYSKKDEHKYDYYDHFGDYKHGDYKKHNDKYNKKYDSYQSKKKYSGKGKYDKYNEYCDPFQKKLECTAFFMTVDNSDVVQLWKSISGQQLELASTYSSADADAVHLFSNWARGAYCPNKDIEFGVYYSNTTTSVGRMRYEKDAATLIYEHLVSFGDSYYNFGPFVTDILIPKGIFYIDAYQTQFDFTQSEFQQIDVNPVTNQEVSTAVGQTPCYDAVFFNKECSRWLCIGNQGGTLTSYMKDPATGQFYIPPPLNNPQLSSQAAIWYTGTLLCGRMRFASIGYDSANLNQWSFVRAKLSLKSPYFKDVEEFYTFSSAGVEQSYIYSPPNTNTVYACAGQRFWKFDDVYTANIPVQPSIEHSDQWIGQFCTRITAFKECTNDVYVSTGEGNLYYSPNGGASFQLVSGVPGSSSNSLVGFAVPT